MKKCLVVYIKYDSTKSIGIRHNYFIKFLKNNFEIQLLELDRNEETVSRQNFSKASLIKRFIFKYFLFPHSMLYDLEDYKKRVKSELKKNNYDSILIFVRPFPLLVLTKYIKKLNSKLNIIVDMSDPFSANNTYINASFFRKQKIFYFERKYLQYVDVLIVLNEAIKKYYNKLMTNRFKVLVIDQGVEPKVIKSNSKSSKNSHISLVYGGKFYWGIREPFKLYKAIIDCKENLILNIYGNLEKHFCPPQNKKINDNGIINQEELFQEYANCDIIVFIDNFIGIQTPGKIIEVLAFSKPILFIYKNENSPTLTYLKNQPCIYLVKNESRLIEKSIRKIIQDLPQDIKRDITQYYWNNILKQLKTI